MSTDGAYGFKKNGEYKVTMCCSSSYYDWLGQNVVDFIKEAEDLGRLNEIYDKIVMIEVDDNYSPDTDNIYIADTKTKLSPEQYEIIKEELDHAEGHLNYYLEDSSKYMIDNESFMGWGFCEYTYIIDLDKNVLMVQKGEEGKEGYRVEYIDLDYILKNDIDLDNYMKNS